MRTTRAEIGNEFGPWLNQLQFAGEGEKDGHVFKCWGIVYVQNPYAPGELEMHSRIKKRQCFWNHPQGAVPQPSLQ